MGRTAEPFTINQRSDRNDKWYLSLNATCGLSAAVCEQYKRFAFSQLPDELQVYQNPGSRAAARRGAMALIEMLKEQDQPVQEHGPLIGDWVRLFLDLETSPRAKRLVSKNQPYSPQTIYNYNSLYNSHLKDDTFLTIHMGEATQKDVLDFLSRIAAHKLITQSKKVETEKQLSGTRQFESLFSFVRMTFREYQFSHPSWVDPFLSIERPKATQTKQRVGLEETEVAKLFSTPGVFLDEMEKAICAAMFWAGLRRSEISALMPEDLDWTTPCIHVDHAWKNFNHAATSDDKKKEKKITRTLGDPKHHKHRTAPFPDVLRAAIETLWEKNGKHEFVFAYTDGRIVSSDYCKLHAPRWFKRAGIDITGRKITPHSSRHSLASVLENQGVPLRYIQEMLGHSDLKTTMGYLHAPQDTINKITAKIDSLDKQ